jgi:hypothetical protein
MERAISANWGEITIGAPEPCRIGHFFSGSVIDGVTDILVPRSCVTTICGAPGSGKTALMNAIFNHNKDSSFVSARDVIGCRPGTDFHPSVKDLVLIDDIDTVAEYTNLSEVICKLRTLEEKTFVVSVTSRRPIINRVDLPVSYASDQIIGLMRDGKNFYAECMKNRFCPVDGLRVDFGIGDYGKIYNPNSMRMDDLVFRN